MEVVCTNLGNLGTLAVGILAFMLFSGRIVWAGPVIYPECRVVDAHIRAFCRCRS